MNKAKAIAEVREYTQKRNDQFDRIKEEASAELAKWVDPNAMMKSPETYLRSLFVKVGVEIIKRQLPEARKIGKDHAQQMGRASRGDQAS